MRPTDDHPNVIRFDRSRFRPERRPPPRRLRDHWTIQRAMATGIGAGLGALLLSAVTASAPIIFFYVYAALLAVTGYCGLSILFITIVDLRSRGRARGSRLHAIRAVDVSVGLLLAASGLYALNLARPGLGF